MSLHQADHIQMLCAFFGCIQLEEIEGLLKITYFSIYVGLQIDYIFAKKMKKLLVQSGKTRPGGRSN